MRFSRLTFNLLKYVCLTVLKSCLYCNMRFDYFGLLAGDASLTKCLEVVDEGMACAMVYVGQTSK